MLDIETAPNLAYVWDLWEQNVGLNQLESVTEVMCFSAKWLGERGTFFYSQHDKNMMAEAWRLLDEADVVMSYNGARFDMPHLNREFVTRGWGPPSPYQQIDLWRVVKRQFNFPSNKLAYVSEALGLEGKVKHEGFELWRKCLAGDEAAWKRMEKYNRRDVTLLEELYEKLQPWVPKHPSRTLHDGTEGCPSCGVDALQKRGTMKTAVSVYQRWHCQNCGAWSRSTRRLAGSGVSAA